MPNLRTMLATCAATACAAAITIFSGTLAHAQPAAGQYILPDSLAPAIPGSPIYKQGGLSGLYYFGGNDFWFITDRGPNVDSGSAKVFPVPAFQPTMFRVRLMVDGSFAIVDSMRLAQPDGSPTSGKPNPAPYSTGESAIDTNFVSIGTDEWGFDTEGLLRSSDGTFWFCEEYAPGIAHVAANGRIIERVRPQPTPGGLPDILKKRVPNRGAEGIAQTPNGKLYTIVQSGMANSYANTATANTAAGNSTEMLRLVEFDPATGSSRMFAYLMDAGYPASGGSNARRRDIKIGDMAAVNNDELILIEHVQRGASNVKKIYSISLTGATPITAEAFETSPGVFKSLEELTRTEITTVAGLTPVAKTLLIDLRAPGAGNTAWPAALDKPEGLAIISPTSIAVGNDNDFGVTSTNANGIISLTGTKSNIIVYTLPSALNLQTQAQVVRDPQGNAPVCPSGSARFTASALGYPAPTVQWQVSTNNGTTYTNVPGATSDTLALNSLAIGMNGNLYRAVYTNSFGTSTSAPAMLHVEDSEAPTITVSVSPTELSPVNGRLRTVTATVAASDNCPGVTYTLTSITTDDDDCDDDDRGRHGHRHRCCDRDHDDNDIRNAAFGTADLSFDLRAERDGRDARTYTITYTATDLAGNTTTGTATVTVPGKKGHLK